MSADGPQPRGHLDPVAAKVAWFRAHWKAILAGVAAFIVGAVAGSSGSSSESSTATVTESITDVVTETVTRTVRAQPPPPRRPPPPAAPRRFTGNGGKTLAPMTLSKDSTMIWTNSGGLFQIFEDELGVPVNSQAHRGTTFVPAGTYTFQVNADGNWTIAFR